MIPIPFLCPICHAPLLNNGAIVLLAETWVHRYHLEQLVGDDSGSQELLRQGSGSIHSVVSEEEADTQEIC